MGVAKVGPCNVGTSVVSISFTTTTLHYYLHRGVDGEHFYESVLADYGLPRVD